MSFAQKIGLINTIKNEIISFPAYRYKKIRDLLSFCEDPTSVDIVMKAMNALCAVYCDIIPSYRIRELNDKTKKQNEDGMEDEEDGKSSAPHKKVQISKEVEAL